MFTDIVGYTAMAQEDEKGAMKLLQRHNEIIRPVLASFHGKEVKTMGDSFLAEFDSALDAVECAAEIQSRLAAFNREESPGFPLHVRIGVHVGDVIHSSGDVFGDAVNLASRVQPLADPDGVCISEQVYVQVRNKVPFKFALMPPQALKNVQFEMNVYKVVLAPPGGAVLDRGVPPRTRVAVLPFTNISHDQTDEYFADGVTEELIAAISQVRELKVIARTSTARYKGTQKSVAEIGRELGIGSVLEGSTRMAGNRVRVTAQLIDASTEEHLWADNYDRELDDIFSIQSEIAKSVSEALKVQLLSGEKVGLNRPTTSSSAFVRYLKGRAALHNRRESDLLNAKKLFEEAIAEDGRFALAHVGLADVYFLLGNNYHIPMADALRSSRAHIDAALSVQPDLPEARVALANLLQNDYRFGEAAKEYEAALAANPSYAHGHHWYAVCLWDMGRAEEEHVEMSKAEELDPLSAVVTFNMAASYAVRGERKKAEEAVAKLRELDPEGYFVYVALAFMAELEGDLTSAVAHLERVVAIRKDDLSSLSKLGELYGRVGESAKARETLSRLEGEKHHDSFQLAMVRGGLGEKDEMFRLLEDAYKSRSIIYRALLIEGKTLGIKDDERYRSLLARVGLA